MGLFDKGVSPEDRQEIIDAAVVKLLENFDAAKEEIINAVATKLLDNDALVTAAMKKALVEEPVIQKVKTRAQKEAEEPWVEIKGLVTDPTHGVRLEMDWNAAFILYLKQQGINGSSDDEIIQRYVAYLSQDIHSQMASDEDRFS